MFLNENALAVEITMSFVEIQEAVFQDKFGINHMIKYYVSKNHWV